MRLGKNFFLYNTQIDMCFLRSTSIYLPDKESYAFAIPLVEGTMRRIVRVSYLFI